MTPTPFLWYELPYPRALVQGLCTRDPKEDYLTSRAGVWIWKISQKNSYKISIFKDNSFWRRERDTGEDRNIYDSINFEIFLYHNLW